MFRLGKGARQQQALQEQYNYIINGPPDTPLFDAAADAAEAVQQLLRADVVLTTFDVLQQVPADQLATHRKCIHVCLWLAGFLHTAAASGSAAASPKQLYGLVIRALLLLPKVAPQQIPITTPLLVHPLPLQEVHFSGNNSERLSSLRHKKRYAVPQSPLLQVHWWRLVLDEAQLVGGGFSATAVMAARLTAVHRWAVTGTPIGAGGGRAGLPA